MLSDVGDLARMRYGVRKLAELVQQPAIVGITDMDDEAPMLMGRDPSADGSTSNAAFPSRMPPAQVLAMSDDELDAWMVFNCGDGIHTTGSCRMGSPDDPRSVVDSDGRVIGLQGLRVADASIMPDVRAVTFCLCLRADSLSPLVVFVDCTRKYSLVEHRDRRECGGEDHRGARAADRRRHGHRTPVTGHGRARQPHRRQRQRVHRGTASNARVSLVHRPRQASHVCGARHLHFFWLSTVAKNPFIGRLVLALSTGQLAGRPACNNATPFCVALSRQASAAARQ